MKTDTQDGHAWVLSPASVSLIQASNSTPEPSGSTARAPLVTACSWAVRCCSWPWAGGWQTSSSGPALTPCPWLCEGSPALQCRMPASTGLGEKSARLTEKSATSMNKTLPLLPALKQGTFGRHAKEHANLGHLARQQPGNRPQHCFMPLRQHRPLLKST